MFGLWERKGKSREPLPEANDWPPDSHRPSGLCPRCDKQSSFETTGHLRPDLAAVAGAILTATSQIR